MAEGDEGVKKTTGVGAFKSNAKAEEAKKTFTRGRGCWICGKADHKSYNCTEKKVSGASYMIPYIDDKILGQLDIGDGTVNGKKVRVMRDTGCTGVIVKRSVVSDDKLNGKWCVCVMIDKTSIKAPMADIEIDSDVYKGKTEAMCMEDPVCELVIGNIPGASHSFAKIVTESKGVSIGKPKITGTNNTVSDSQDNDSNNPMPENHETGSKHQDSNNDYETHLAQAVVTRAQAVEAKKPVKKLKTISLPNFGSAQEFRNHQQQDTSLMHIRGWVSEGKKQYRDKSGDWLSYVVKGDLIYRVIEPTDNGNTCEQLVVPHEYREVVLKLAHESMFAGHMGITKTTDRIRSDFFWPNMYDDIARFCKSCDVCQRTVPKGKIPKAPLGKMPVISTPFYRVAVDLVGPLLPVSGRGHRWILTMVDMATRYPLAAPLASIDTATVAEAMVDMFSDIGIPNEILSDRGSQFNSDMMREVQRLLSIRAFNTSPYHAQCNGLCEKYNGTLKQMLKRTVDDQPKEWDRFIKPLLFAYRDVPIDSLGGFSPFELIYGHTVRGPMSVLHELWTKNDLPNSIKDTYEYVLDLKTRLEKTCLDASKMLLNSQQKQKVYFDKKAVERNLKAGDEVLILLPSDNNKLLMRWKGPFMVKAKTGQYNYAIEIGNNIKNFHINMLKQYFRRERNVVASVASITFEDDDASVMNVESSNVPTKGKVETHCDVNINPELLDSQKAELKDLISEFSEIFSSQPGTTNLLEHKIALTDKTPIRIHPYPVPYSMYDEMRKEVNDMLELDVIEPSESPYCSPIVLVKKKDGSTRYCQDMRQVNKVTKFDCESLPDIDYIYAKCANSIFYSKIDFCKGYWQIPLESNCKEITAFSTPFGNYQYKKMPFGLVNSGATYAKMMRLLLKDAVDVDNFVDDVLVHTCDWDTQLTRLRDLFSRIKNANLTIKPSKCYFGYKTVDFTGHTLSNGYIRTQKDKVEQLSNAKRPGTKKELRSFLGMAGYYRKFIGEYADKVKPLTDLTKKSSPNKLPWTDVHQKAFDLIKSELCKDPILRVPDISKPFILSTDASDTGIAAVLKQEYDGKQFPVAYMSKKLLPCQQKYSVVERECLAICWAIERLKNYLFGREFVLQTDNTALTYLNSAKFTNDRVMRWAMMLQPYRFRVVHVRGEDNCDADFLSRQ